MSISPTTVTSLLPLVLGGVFSYFKPFLEDQREFKNRCARMHARSTESIAIALTRLLQEALQTRGFDDVARGDGDRTPDLYGDVATMIARHSKLAFRISVRLLVFHGCYGLLLLGLIVGLLGFIASLVFDAYEAIIVVGCIGTAVFQIIAVTVLYALTRRSENDEDIL